MRRNHIGIITLVFLMGAPCRAQSVPPTRYTPTYQNPSGRELVAVLVSSSTCVANAVPGFLGTVDVMNRLLAKQAAAHHIPFVAIGVATDWVTDSGYAYLRRLSNFDEVVVGRNWFNLAVAHYVWAQAGRAPVEPQLILLERDTRPTGRRVEITPDRVIANIEGPDSLMAWVRRGAPLPALAP